MKRLFLKITETMARWLPDGFKRAIYRFRPLARLLRSGLNKAVPQGVSRVTIAGGGLKNAQMDLDMHSEKDYWLGTYELGLQHAISHFIKPGMTAYDVGANIGYISLLLARAVGESGKVVSVEALPANVNRLQGHVALNPFAACVKVLPAAVVDVSAPVTFLVHGSTSMGKAVGSAGRPEHYEKEITVDGVSLDELVYQQGYPAPDVIKMDIEGGEVLAVQGMKRLLKEKPPLILVELHGREAVQMVYRTLFAAGYTFFQMQDHYPQVTSESELDKRAYLVAKPPSGR